MLPDEARGGGGSSGGWPEAWDAPRARVAAFLVAALLWTAGSLHRSLWEDEFHSLYHASAGSVTELLERVRGDNHPPLSFLLQKLSCDLLGETAFALRLPTLLAGLGALLLYVGLARRLTDPAARAIAPWLAASSSYFLWIVTTARMYAWLALAALGLLHGVLAALEGTRSRWWISAWIALGLHSHYHSFHYLALLGLACVVAHAVSPGEREGLRRCVSPALAGAALFAPWAIHAFWHQLGTGDPPTASYRGWRVWSESYAHFLFLYPRAGGDLVHYGLALPGALAGAVLGISGVLRLARGIRAGGTRTLPVTLLVLALLGPSWVYLASLVSPRSGFHLKYLVSFAGPLLLIVATGVSRAIWSRALAGFLLVAMLAVTLANVASRGRQNIHGAVSYILDHARPGDAVVVRPWWSRDPERSPTDYGWYARRLARGRPGPVEIPVDRTDQEARAYPRVWLIHTGDSRRWVRAFLGEHFRNLETIPIDPEATVYLYSDPR
jgi:4-amino-4-deoxy-L-arabinose transferase-like glycosyltransferase